MRSSYINKPILFAVVCLMLFFTALSQTDQPAALSKKVDRFVLKNKTAAESLDLLSEKTGVLFSYKTDILSQGRTFDLAEEKKTLGQLLYRLFKDSYEYEEQAGYIIVRPRHSYFIISGFVVDALTGKPSEKAQVSTLADAFQTETDSRGYFELKIPRQHKVDYVTIRKDFYSDGFMEIRAAEDKSLFVSLQPLKTVELLPVTTSNTPSTNESKVAISPFGTKRRATTRLAFGGLFNNNLKDARNLQLAGVVNIVRGSLSGVQIAGIHNLVLDTTEGVQISGLINRSEGLVKGVQAAAVNRAKNLKGLQIGVVNIADSSGGYSLGLINIVRSKNGYRRLSLYATDLTNTNLSLKLGNAKLYSVILAGANISNEHKLYSVGWGLGHDFLLGKNVSVSVEANYQFVDAGSWDNRLLQFRSSLAVQVMKAVLLFAGPVYNRYADNQGYRATGYKEIIPYTGTALFERGTKRWIGWQAGVTAADLFSGGNGQAPGRAAGHWSLQAGIAPGVDPRGSFWYAIDLLMQRDFREGIAARGGIAMNNRTGSIPLDPGYNVKAGLRVSAQKTFYVAGDIGLGMTDETRIDHANNTVMRQETKWRFLWSPSFGWKLGQFDISAKYESLYDPFFVRLAYTVWRSRL